MTQRLAVNARRLNRTKFLSSTAGLSPARLWTNTDGRRPAISFRARVWWASRISRDCVAGMVQLNNWKPLPFDKITDNQDASVETLLKDVSNHLTLKILTKQ